MKASRGYYIAKRIAFACLAGYVGIIAVGFLLFAMLQVPDVTSTAPWLLYLPVGLAISWFVAMIVYSLWRCPACGKSIHTNWLGFSNPYSRSCVHCGEVVGWFSPPKDCR